MDLVAHVTRSSFFFLVHVLEMKIHLAIAEIRCRHGRRFRYLLLRMTAIAQLELTDRERLVGLGCERSTEQRTKVACVVFMATAALAFCCGLVHAHRAVELHIHILVAIQTQPRRRLCKSELIRTAVGLVAIAALFGYGLMDPRSPENLTDVRQMTHPTLRGPDPAQPKPVGGLVRIVAGTAGPNAKRAVDILAMRERVAMTLKTQVSIDVMP